MIQALAIGLALALAATGVQTWRLHSLQTEVAQERQRRAEEDLERERQRAAYDQALNEGVRKATDAWIRKTRAARAAADGLDGAYRGVLDAINAAGGTADDPAAACRAAGERVAKLERLLGEGAGLAAEGARRVDALDAKLSGLQEHTRAQMHVSTTP